MSAIIEKHQKFDRRKAFDIYRHADLAKSVWQLANTLGLYALTLFLMFRSLSVHYGWTLLLSLFAASMVIRLFIIFHDCVHGSFFASKQMTHIIGNIVGLLIFTPFRYWRTDHLQHHASVCNLDKQGIGDVWTMALKDYSKGSAWQRLQYAFTRNPAALLFTAPIFLRNRIPPKDCPQQEKMSIFFTNMGSLALIAASGLWIGFGPTLLIILPIFFFASAFGSWLFYVQHQFEGARWERSDQWDYTTAALEGTSFYDLPKILHWLTGNIGYHHVHHLCPKVPNYKLAACYKNNPPLQDVKKLTLLSSLRTFRNQVWDEAQREFVSFKNNDKSVRSDK